MACAVDPNCSYFYGHNQNSYGCKRARSGVMACECDCHLMGLNSCDDCELDNCEGSI